MTERQLLRDITAHRMAEHVRALDPQSSQQRRRIFGHHLDRIGHLGLLRMSGAPIIESESQERP
jgi:hypothetical protein